MEILPEGSKLCPCYKECQEFLKLVELKGCGLVIYCHTSNAQGIKQGEAVASASCDVFILHNKKDVKVTTSQLTSEIEKESIRCPRCKKRFQRLQELMKDIKSLDRRIVIGVCDHCRKRAQFSKKTFCVCEKIVHLFKTVKGGQTEDTIKYETILPPKTEHLGKVPQKIKLPYSGLQINPDIKSPAAEHEPEVTQMIYSNKYFQSDDTEMSESDSKDDYLKRVSFRATFAETIIPIETTDASTSHDGKKINPNLPDTSSIGSVAAFVEPYVGVRKLPRPFSSDRQQIEVFEDKSSIYAKAELKRRHDLSLRQMFKHEKDSGVSISISKRPGIYETAKSAPSEKKQAGGHQVESEKNIKKIPTKTKHELDDVTNKPSKLESPRKKENLQDSDIEPSKFDKERRDKIKKGSEELAKNVKKLDDSYFVTNTKLGRNVKKIEHRLAKPSSKRKSEESFRNPQFSYVFPKKKEKKEKHINVKASVIIRDAHEKYKKRKDQERKGIQEQREKDQLGREARKQQDLEKYIYMDDQQRLPQRDKSKEIAKKDKILKSARKVKGAFKKSKSEHQVKDAVKRSKSEQKVKSAVKKSKSEHEVKDAVEEKFRSKFKVEGAERKEKTNTVEEDKLEIEERDTLKSQKGERDAKLQRYKQTGNEILKQIGKEKLKQIGKEKLKQIGKEKLKEIGIEKLKQIGIEKLKEEKLGNKDVQIGKDELKEESIENVAAAKKKRLESSDDTKTSSNKDKNGGKISTKTQKPKDAKVIAELKRLQAAHFKAKAEAQKKKLLHDTQKEKQDTELDLKELKMKPVNQAQSNDYLKLVQIKQTPKIFDFNSKMLKGDIIKHNLGRNVLFGELSLDSELELDVLSLNNKRNQKKDNIQNIIRGERIYRYKPNLEEKSPDGVVPILFQEEALESEIQKDVQILPKEVAEVLPVVKKNNLATDVTKKHEVGTEGSGIIRYALSDRTFIDKGWTMLPTEKVVRMMNVYRMRPAHPEFDWFKHNKDKRLMTYDTGEKLAEFDDNGRGRWYYRNGRLALDYYDAEEANAQQRFVVYSSGEPDERGRTHPITILATFDYQGNGIVFDHAGKIRLKYNQTEGVVLDRSIGPVSHWKWHSLNDPPILQQVMIDNQLLHKDPDILKLGSSTDVTIQPDNEEMMAIEFANFIKEKTRKLSQKLIPFQIKMKALKINEHFSLKVLDQATVYLIFRDGLTNLKVNMGMILDETEIVDTETAELGEVSSTFEHIPARSDSLAGLQRSVAHAKRYERHRAERERRLLRPLEPCASADIMTAAISTPMRLPFRTVPTGSSSTTRYCSKKPLNNLYYDTRLLC